MKAFCNLQGKQQCRCLFSSPEKHADHFHCSPWTPSPSSCVWCVVLSLHQKSGPGPHTVCWSQMEEKKPSIYGLKTEVNSSDEDDWPIDRFSTTSSPSGISSLHDEVSLKRRQTHCYNKCPTSKMSIFTIINCTHTPHHFSDNNVNFLFYDHMERWETRNMFMYTTLSNRLRHVFYGLHNFHTCKE